MSHFSEPYLRADNFIRTFHLFVCSIFSILMMRMYSRTQNHPLSASFLLVHGRLQPASEHHFHLTRSCWISLAALSSFFSIFLSDRDKTLQVLWISRTMIFDWKKWTRSINQFDQNSTKFRWLLHDFDQISRWNGHRNRVVISTILLSRDGRRNLVRNFWLSVIHSKSTSKFVPKCFYTRRSFNIYADIWWKICTSIDKRFPIPSSTTLHCIW